LYLSLKIFLYFWMNYASVIDFPFCLCLRERESWRNLVKHRRQYSKKPSPNILMKSFIVYCNYSLKRGSSELRVIRNVLSFSNFLQCLRCAQCLSSLNHQVLECLVWCKAIHYIVSEVSSDTFTEMFLSLFFLKKRKNHFCILKCMNM
jgi:hypothetical protein